jgi:hypothetical protein
MKKPKTAAERAASYAARMHAQGFARVPVWVPATEEAKGRVHALAAVLRRDSGSRLPLPQPAPPAEAPDRNQTVTPLPPALAARIAALVSDPDPQIRDRFLRRLALCEDDAESRRLARQRDESELAQYDLVAAIQAAGGNPQ